MRTLLLLLIATTAAAQTPDYERILVPVFFQGAGAFGSNWMTTVEIANTGSTPIRFSQPLLQGNPVCLICSCSPTDRVEAETVDRLCILNANPAGLILYRDKSSGDSADVHFGGRIADISRSSETAGTELRIVRESELRQGRIVLPNIPVGANYRVALRVFDARPFPGIVVTMRVLDHFHLFLTSTLEASIPLAMPSDASHPAFGMIPDLATTFPQLAAGAVVTIELLLPEPLISPPRPPAYWAVASITNNTTQQVTMVTPQ